MNTTLNEIMAQDTNVWLGENNKFGYDMWIQTEDGETELNAVHPYAIDSLADFCRQFLHHYDRVQSKLEAA